MGGSIIQFLISAAFIVGAGAVLTQCGDVISNKTKLGGLFVGTILIAGATSLPELAIDINAIRLESANMAAGDLFGSSLFNLLILAVLDLTHYSKGQMLSKSSASQALAATTSIALTAIAGIFVVLGDQMQNVTFLRLGPGSFVIFIAYIVGFRIVYFGRKQGAKQEKGETDHENSLPFVGKLSLKAAVIGYIVAAVIILAAAPFLARAAKTLAEETGLGGTYFGTTFVALSTSLPEMVTTFSAVRLKSFDMAVGNIFGSNCFNMLLFAPLDLVDAGPLLASVSSSHAFTAFCVIIVTSSTILGQLYKVEKKHFLEPDALLTIVLIAASLTGLYFVRE